MLHMGFAHKVRLAQEVGGLHKKSSLGPSGQPLRDKPTIRANLVRMAAKTPTAGIVGTGFAPTASYDCITAITRPRASC
jgi:hypothetical protein